ncbi:putative endoribonuclease with L-PSP Domain [marine gamma proteobacterium HTCC2080]|jgi:2-iminobutanoate/2-iminopropanoate deaminase|nr:putative endoribonuclease with L-PSP Domain [marine gamma proteobacterium HTCC2080]
MSALTRKKLKTQEAYMRLIKSITLSTLFFAATVSGSENNPSSSLHEVQTPVGSFYSSELSLEQNFPFSDMVHTAGGLVFLSGLVGSDDSGQLVSGGLGPETHAIFGQLKAHLAQLNLGLKDIVKCLVMIDDIEKWGDFNAIYTSYFVPPYPARSAMGADGLALGAALELECIAVKK